MLRFLLRFLLLALTAASHPAYAQRFVHVPDPSPRQGTLEYVPFGSSPGHPTWRNQRCQILVQSTRIGTSVLRIAELGFASDGHGLRRFERLVIRLDHHPGPALAPAFAQNLSPGAVTVLDVADHAWPNTADGWNRIGLQRGFFYIAGLGHLLLDIEVRGAGIVTTSGTPYLRGGDLQRLHASAWDAAPPATGTLDSGGLRVELGEDVALADPFGSGCAGSAGVPTLQLSGVPRLRSTCGIEVEHGPPGAAAVLVVGAARHAPSPLVLPGTAGCRMFHAVSVWLPVTLDARGSAGVLLPVPGDLGLIGHRMYVQYYLRDTAANALGLTTSDFGRLLVGL